MRKLFLILLAVVVLLASYRWQGGMIAALFSPVAMIPLIVGSLLSTLVTFEWREIGAAFREGFTKAYQRDKIPEYLQSLLVVKNLQAATLYWALAIIVASVIQVLSQLATPERMGVGVAAVCTVLLYSFCMKALLYIPMESNLNRKISPSGETMKQREEQVRLG